MIIINILNILMCNSFTNMCIHNTPTYIMYLIFKYINNIFYFYFDKISQIQQMCDRQDKEAWSIFKNFFLKRLFLASVGNYHKFHY